jgi:hypothetical protein
LERCKGRRRVECFWILIVGQFEFNFLTSKGERKYDGGFGKEALGMRSMVCSMDRDGVGQWVD